MDFMTSTILSGVVYDIFKNGVLLSIESLKERLKKWSIDEVIMPQIQAELEKIGVNDELSEIAIKRRIESSSTLMELIGKAEIKNVSKVINQYHYGSGDNVVGNKIVNE